MLKWEDKSLDRFFDSHQKKEEAVLVWISPEAEPETEPSASSLFGRSSQDTLVGKREERQEKAGS